MYQAKKAGEKSQEMLFDIDNNFLHFARDDFWALAILKSLWRHRKECERHFLI
jgi:hypothetical protein